MCGNIKYVKTMKAFLLLNVFPENTVKMSTCLYSICMVQVGFGFNVFCNNPSVILRSVHMAEWLALPTSDHGVMGSNPAGGEILPEPKWRFIAQSLSCSPFHRLEMTEILLKGRKTLTHPSIHPSVLLHHSCSLNVTRSLGQTYSAA